MDEIITTLKTLLAAAMGSTYTYVYGEVKVPSDTVLPLIEIIPVSTIINRLGTGELTDNEFTVRINYKNTLKKFVDNDTSVTTLAHMQDAVNVMEDRSSVTGQPDSDTILGTILDNIRISNYVDVGQDISIEYDINEYGDSWITVASLTFTAKKKTPIN